MIYNPKNRKRFGGRNPRKGRVMRVSGRNRTAFVNLSSATRARLMKEVRDRVVDPGKLGLNDYSLSKLKQAYSLGQKLSSTTKGDITASFVKTANDVGRTFNLSGIATVAQTSVSNKRLGPQELRWHKTKLMMGKPTSSTLKRIAKNNGTTRKTLYDSNTSGGSVGLTWNYGFNQRNIRTFATNGIVTSSDYASLWPTLDTNVFSQNTQQRSYGAILKEIMTYKFANTSSYFPSVLKIEWLRLATDLQSGADMAVNSMNVTAAVQSNGRIPVNKQFTDRVLVGDMIGCITHPNLTLESSTIHRSRTERVKTLTRTLQPGEIWTVEVEINCGSGIDLARLKSAVDQEVDGVISLLPVITSNGKLCELRTALTNASNIGTSPGYISMEAKAEVEYVNAPIERTPTATKQGFAPRQPLIRVFTGDAPILGEVLFNADVSDIGDPASALYYCPVMTDMDPSFAKQQAGT